MYDFELKEYYLEPPVTDYENFGFYKCNYNPYDSYAIGIGCYRAYSHVPEY